MPDQEVLDHIGGKWSIGIIAAAAAWPIRFTELERTIEGISRRMLTLNLRKLERDGLLIRTVYPTVPPEVEYRLTPIARELSESFATLTAWRNGTVTPSPRPADNTTASPAAVREIKNSFLTERTVVHHPEPGAYTSTEYLLAAAAAAADSAAISAARFSHRLLEGLPRRLRHFRLPV